MDEADVSFNSRSTFSEFGFVRIARGGQEALRQESCSLETDEEVISEPGLQKNEAEEDFGAFTEPDAAAETDFSPFAGAPSQVGVTAGRAGPLHVPVTSEPVLDPGDFDSFSQSQLVEQREGSEEGLFLSQEVKASTAPALVLPPEAQVLTPPDAAGTAGKMFMEGAGTEVGDDGGFGAFSEPPTKETGASSFGSFVEPRQAEGVGALGSMYPVEPASTNSGTFASNEGDHIANAFQEFSAAPEGAQNLPAAQEFEAFTSAALVPPAAAPETFGAFTIPASTGSLYPNVNSSTALAPSAQLQAPAWPTAPPESFGDFVSPAEGVVAPDGKSSPADPAQGPDPASLFADLTPTKGARGL